MTYHVMKTESTSRRILKARRNVLASTVYSLAGAYLGLVPGRLKKDTKAKSLKIAFVTRYHNRLRNIDIFIFYICVYIQL